ncbi:hypothetical protein Aperf_G00000022378 [Anoplocephala perfoliata]
MQPSCSFEHEYKIDPEEKTYLNFNNQYSQEGYNSGTGPLNLQNIQPPQTSIQSQPPISEIIPSDQNSADIADYQQVHTGNSLVDKYSANESLSFLNDSGFDEQLMSAYSEPCYDYSLQSSSGSQSLNASNFQINPAEDEFRPLVQDSRTSVYDYGTATQHSDEYGGFYKSENQDFVTQELSGCSTPQIRKRRTYDTQPSSEPSRVRTASNCQLNTTAVAIMDSWYRSHLDRPYPNKEEKMRMAVAGDITETQVGSWFANRRNRSNNTRPKQNMKRLKGAIASLCMEYQNRCNGLINGAEMQARIVNLIEHHMKF